MSSSGAWVSVSGKLKPVFRPLLSQVLLSQPIRNAKEKLTGPTSEKPNGGDYWRQAVFYKLLIENDRTKDWQVTGTQFDFVEPVSDGEYRNEKIMVGPEDTAIVRDQIKTVYQKIMAHDFSVGCGKEECDWCHFVRSNFKQPGNIMEEAENEDFN